MPAPTQHTARSTRHANITVGATVAGITYLSVISHRVVEWLMCHRVSTHESNVIVNTRSSFDVSKLPADGFMASFL